MKYGSHIAVWDLKSRETVLEQRLGIVRSFCWSGNQSDLMAADFKGVVTGISMAGEVRSIASVRDLFRDGVSSLSPNGHWIAMKPMAVDSATEVVVLDLSTQEIVGRIPLGYNLNCIEWSPDSRLIAVGGWRRAAVLDPFSGSVVSAGATSYVTQAIAWAPDGERVAIGGSTGEVNTYAVMSLEPLGKIRRHRGPVHGLDWIPEGRIASASEDGTVRVYDDELADELLVLEHPEGLAFQCVRWDRQGKALGAGDSKGRVFVWGSGEMPEPVVKEKGDCLND